MDERVLKILRGAKRRLRGRDAWTRGEYARDVEGNESYPTDASAVSWCLAGACVAEGATDSTDDPALVLIESCLPKGQKWLANFNDDPSTKKKDVLAVLDCAIKKASQ